MSVHRDDKVASAVGCNSYLYLDDSVTPGGSLAAKFATEKINGAF